MSSVSQIPISRFSKMTLLTPKALRLYDEKGLLVPMKDPINKYRYYSIDQVEVGIKIKFLVTMGFGIEEIDQILNAASYDDKEFLDSIFSNKLSDIQLEIHRLKKIEDIITNNDPKELLYMNCTQPVIKEFPKTRVISRREKGTYGQTIGKLIGDLFREINDPVNQEAMVKIMGPIMFICHDKEFKEFDADIEVAVPISGRIKINSEEVELKNIPGSKVISVIYTGPYGDIGVAYSKAIEYFIQHDFEEMGSMREIYLNDPNSVPEEELMTELQIPIKERE